MCKCTALGEALGAAPGVTPGVALGETLGETFGETLTKNGITKIFHILGGVEQLFCCSTI